MDIKAVEKVVGKIQTTLFKSSNSFSVGTFKSHFRGSGLQFKEHQIYNPGDEVRFIDWKLSAKTNTTYIKTFEEERNVEICIIVDLNRSMLYGYKGISKLKAALEIVCLFYLLAQKTKDKVKVLLLGEKIEITPLSSGKQGITQLINILEKMNVLNSNGEVNLDFKISNKTSNNEKNILVKSYLARKKEVVILSDFHDFFDEIDWKNLMYKKNLHCYCLTSPLDQTKSLPFSIKAMSSNDKLETTKFLGANTELTGKISEHLKGKISYIDVSERYLENFVKSIK